MPDRFAIDVRFYRLSDELAPYFTALYSFTVDCPPGSVITDRLHPEWSAMRFTESGLPPIAGVVPDAQQDTWPFVISGPTSRAIAFSLQRSRIWGLGLRPAGWARYVGVPARDLADRIVDAGAVDALARFAPILDIVRQAGPDPDTKARAVDAYLRSLAPSAHSAHAMILACQEALRDPDIGDVEALASRLGMGRRALERLCARHFGFPPKLLLRRQRFLRSLARFMLERSDTGAGQNWSRALDVQYFDHAHFVRDFRSFMGMTPTEYADAPHPVLDRIMGQRMADQGAAPQTDLPTMLRYAGQVPGAAGMASDN